LKLPETMQAIVLSGHGGLEKLSVEEEWSVPEPGPGQVLIKVGAAGMNNTDINTRIGWYSKAVRGETNEGSSGFSDGVDDDGGWAGEPIDFPRIQGADCCGTIVATGEGVAPSRAGERVLVRTMQPAPDDGAGKHCITYGSEMHGGFAEYAIAPAKMVSAVNCGLSDAELASFPCASTTAENMLERIGLGSGERVLITGATGGVGSAAVQLAGIRGAQVTAMGAASKHDFLIQIGASAVLDRDATPPARSFDVVVDLVAGPGWPHFIEALRNGGRYITAGAIAGPIVELDIRDLYLRDLTLAGSTWQPMHILDNLITLIEAGKLRPTVSKVYPFSKVHAAQQDFTDKTYPGKLVLVPDALYSPSD